jgi:hypothetical protein
MSSVEFDAWDLGLEIENRRRIHGDCDLPFRCDNPADGQYRQGRVAEDERARPEAPAWVVWVHTKPQIRESLKECLESAYLSVSKKPQANNICILVDSGVFVADGLSAVASTRSAMRSTAE